MEKFAIEINGQDGYSIYTGESREAVQARFLELNPHLTETDIYVRYYSSVLGAENSAHVEQIIRHKITEKDTEYRAYIVERLRSCKDLADILGVEAQESLRNCLERIAHPESRYEIVGRDTCPFSLSFKLAGSIYGALIFHHSAKQWSMHT
jgi:hypothetical protein